MVLEAALGGEGHGIEYCLPAPYPVGVFKNVDRLDYSFDLCFHILHVIF